MHLQKPFNASLTRSEPFYDEENNDIGNVQMMTQMGNFNYTRMTELEAHVLELPYGNENRLSMLIILPNKGKKPKLTCSQLISNYLYNYF